MNQLSIFLSGSGEDRSNNDRPKGKRSTVYKEDVAKALTQYYNVPVMVAEVAVIDLRYMVNVGYHEKQTPRETAYVMSERVNQVYNHEGKRWIHTLT